MSAIYDNWERLVAAVLNEQPTSPSTCSLSSSSSSFSFSRLNSSFDDLPVGFSSPDWPASNQKRYRRRNLTIQVPKPDIENFDLSRDHLCPEYCSIVSSTISPRVNRDYAKQRSYPLPLPPTAISNSSQSHASVPKSAAKLSSPPSLSPKGAENVKGPGTSWKKGKLIGKGPLGDVYLGFNSEKGQMCAMKEVSLSPNDPESRQNARSLEMEIALLSRINHPNIVQYYGSEMVGDNFYIYFGYVSGGPISMILQQYGRLGESVIRNYTQQILSGLTYLHSKSIAHRDIKGANALVDPNGKVKLCGFAFEQHIAEQSRMSWFMDSFYWMAPEFIINSNECKLAVDIWSLGCTILEMATARPPLSQYDRGVAMYKIANHEELPHIPDHLSDVCKDFLRHCLQWDPQQRATASQLLDHPFMKTSLPLGKQILVSTNAAKSEGTDHARSPHQLDSRKVISHASKSPNSNFEASDIYTTRNKSAPVSPVKIPLPHPISAPVSPVWSPLPHPRSAPVSPVGSPLPHPRSAPVSPVWSPLPHPSSAPVSPVWSPLPHPRSAPVSPVWSSLPHPSSAPVSPVVSPLSHSGSAPVSPVGSPLLHPKSIPVSPFRSALPHPKLIPVSPVGSPLPLPRSPQDLNLLMPPSPISSPNTTPKPMINGVEAILHSPLNQSSLRKDTSYNFPNHSPKSNTPSYWDPSILRGVFKFS